MFTHYDPDWNDATSYDDRNADRADFEIDEELAYGLGMDEMDPAML